MAIAHDNTETAASNTISAYTINNASGNDRFVIVGSSSEENIITNVTLNSVAGTFLGVAGTAEGWCEMWRWDDGQLPSAAGDYAVVVTGGVGNQTGAMGFTGVDQTTPLGTVFTASGASGGTTVDVTGTASDELVVDTNGAKDASANTAGAGQTQRYSGLGSGGDVAGGGSTEPGNGGTVTMSWTATGNSDGWGAIAVAMKPAAGGGGGLPIPVAMHAYRQQHQSVV